MSGTSVSPEQAVSVLTMCSAIALLGPVSPPKSLTDSGLQRLRHSPVGRLDLGVLEETLAMALADIDKAAFKRGTAPTLLLEPFVHAASVEGMT